MTDVLISNEHNTPNSLGATVHVASKQMDYFPNPYPQRDFVIHIEMPEFTCLCPKTGQPDFATLVLDYIPADRCVELKSLKLYIWSYRNEGAFHEAVTNQILDHLVDLLQPRYMRLVSHFRIRGGIDTRVSVEHVHPDWKPSHYAIGMLHPST